MVQLLSVSWSIALNATVPFPSDCTSGDSLCRVIPQRCTIFCTISYRVSLRSTINSTGARRPVPIAKARENYSAPPSRHPSLPSADPEWCASRQPLGTQKMAEEKAPEIKIHHERFIEVFSTLYSKWQVRSLRLPIFGLLACVSRLDSRSSSSRAKMSRFFAICILADVTFVLAE